MKVIYVAGPFRASDAWQIKCNVHRAESAANEIAALGAMPLTPHSIGANFHGTHSDHFWLEGTLELLRRCDAVLVLPDFEKSSGTRGELREADRLQIPIYFDIASLKRWLEVIPRRAS